MGAKAGGVNMSAIIHYDDVIMGAIVFQITSLTIAYSIDYGSFHGIGCHFYECDSPPTIVDVTF